MALWRGIGRQLLKPVGVVGQAGRGTVLPAVATLRGGPFGSAPRAGKGHGGAPPAPRSGPAPRDRGARPASFDEVIREAAERQGVDEELVRAVVEAESGFQPGAVSRAGAMGLMQLMPGTARSLGVADPFDPTSNVEGGSRYLRSMLDRFGSVPLALAAYNAGPGAVERYGGIPPYRETQTYVSKVLQIHRRNQAVAAAEGVDRGGNGAEHTV